MGKKAPDHLLMGCAVAFLLLGMVQERVRERNRHAEHQHRAEYREAPRMSLSPAPRPRLPSPPVMLRAPDPTVFSVAPGPRSAPLPSQRRTVTLCPPKNDQRFYPLSRPEAPPSLLHRGCP
jgi:hypothetical protein